MWKEHKICNQLAAKVIKFCGPIHSDDVSFVLLLWVLCVKQGLHRGKVGVVVYPILHVLIKLQS